MLLRNLTDREKEIFLNLAHAVIAADKILEEKEKQYFEHYIREMVFDSSNLQFVSDITPMIVELSASTCQTKRAMFVELISLAYIDGSVCKEEEMILSRLASAFGITEQEVETIVRLQKEYMDAYNSIVSFVNVEQV